MQYQYVSKLSGGEKRRLYLVTVLMQNPNFLILDEPTNDLDIYTLNVLEEYLSSFQGCVLVVSHDRYFMDKVVDHLFVFSGNGMIKDFPGNYTIYKDFMEQIKREEDQKEKLQIHRKEKPKTTQIKKLTFKEKLELEQLEKEIDNLESEKKSLESAINSATLSFEELIEKSTLYSKIIETIDEKTLRWMELSEK